MKSEDDLSRGEKLLGGYGGGDRRRLKAGEIHVFVAGDFSPPRQLQSRSFFGPAYQPPWYNSLFHVHLQFRIANL